MKRSLDQDPAVAVAVEIGDEKMKKMKIDGEGEGEEEVSGFVNLDEDLLFEILKHVDAKSLGSAACVSKQWSKAAKDERLWEMICTRHWSSKTGSSEQQLRKVVLRLGGFRRLHALCLWPLLKPSNSSSPMAPSSSSHWGKDEVHLSLSLLSICYYEKMAPLPRNSK